MTRNQALRKALNMSAESRLPMVLFRALVSMQGLRPNQRFNCVFLDGDAHRTMGGKIEELAYVFPSTSFADYDWPLAHGGRDA